ncbi:MAG: hypothetical protein PHD99_04790 [Candidatus Moranbacteria bacterium]|nr:hypothetical protein [Candidatus Moranbacteria bacterium]
MTRLLNILYVLDCLVLMVVTLGGAKVGETISSAACSLDMDNKWLGRVLRPLIDTLFWFDEDHCAQAYFTYLRITGALKK